MVDMIVWTWRFNQDRFRYHFKSSVMCGVTSCRLVKKGVRAVTARSTIRLGYPHKLDPNLGCGGGMIKGLVL